MSVRARDHAQSDYLALYGGDFGTWTNIAATRQEPPPMHFTIERSALLAAVRLARVAVATKTPMPILEHFLLDATPDGGLVVTATDFAIALAATATAVVKTPGRATVPAQLAVAMLAQCAAPTLTVTLDKGKVRLTGAGTKLALPSLDAVDFPEIYGGEVAPLADCDAGVLRAAVSRVAFAAAQDDSRPALSGVHLAFAGSTLTLSATNGFRIALTVLPVHRPEGAPDETVTIPAKLLTDVLGALPDGQLAIGRARNMIIFTGATARAFCRTIDGAFPDLRGLMPVEYPLTARLPRAELRDAAKLAALAAGSDGRGKDHVTVLDLAIGVDGMVVSGTEDSEAEIAVGAHGTPEGEDTIALDAGYFVQAIGALDGDAIRFRIGQPRGLAVLIPDADGDPTTIQGIMPIARKKG